MTDSRAKDAKGVQRVFTEFGQAQVCQIAQEKAEQVSSRNTVWRYEAEKLLGLLQLGTGLGMILALFAVVVSPILDYPMLEALKHFALYSGATFVLRWAGAKVRNPEVNFSG